jgi:uncharacterized protein (TIGR03435 family)
MFIRRSPLPLYLVSFMASAFSVPVSGQEPAAAASAAFEAASVKPNNSGARAGTVRATPGRMVGSNASVKMLLQEAFNVKSYQVSGGPSWLESDRFDVEAKAEDGGTEDQMRPMLQTLLADRFKLLVHRETKEMRVSALMVASGGFKLHELKAGEPAPVPPPRREDWVGMIVRTGPVSDLAAILSEGAVGVPVIDETGLKGRYLFNVVWGPGEDMVTVILEQLGLKFETQKAPIEILVIDHLEKPGEN